MDLFGFHFSYLSLCILALLLIAFIVQIYYYTRYFMGIIRHNKLTDNEEVKFANDKQAVSVIICARDEEDNLRKYLPFVLEQDYDNYEVIVINDGSTDGTDDYLAYMSKQYSEKLRTSFVPRGATNISTKKLGLTLGIKAAKNDLLLFTDADCMPEGKDWLSSMTRNFDEDTEFVLGYGGYLHEKGFLNKIIKYDTLFAALQYLGMAEAGKPYMGVGRNLAYRKETFFKMKGFASNLNLKSGDDDLFVNQGANADNTRIEASSASITWSEPKKTFKDWALQKERHLSVSDRYSSSSKIRLATEPISRFFFYISLTLLILVASLSNNWILVGLSSIIFISRYLLQLYVINNSAKLLGERRFYLLILLFDIILPIYTLHILMFGKKNRNIKWK